MTELQLHIAVVHALRQMAVPGLVYFHSPNGGLRDKREAAKLKAMGVLPGVPDLVFILPGGKAAFLELKREKGKLSEAQIEFFKAVIALGCRFARADNLDDAMRVLCDWNCIDKRFSWPFKEPKPAKEGAVA